MSKEEQSILQGQAPSEEELAWLKHLRTEEQKAPERVEEAAKYLAGIIAICLTIFLDKRPENLAADLELLLQGTSLLWMVAAVLSFFVLFPTRYDFTQDAPASIKAAFQQAAKVKRSLLRIALICFIIGLGMAIFVFFEG